MSALPPTLLDQLRGCSNEAEMHDRLVGLGMPASLINTIQFENIPNDISVSQAPADISPQPPHGNDLLGFASPAIMSILTDSEISQSLSNPRVVEALQSILENPSRADDYNDDPEISRILDRMQEIIHSHH
jgi:hypothetical protein